MMKKLKVDKADYPGIQLHLLEGAAGSMPNWNNDFSW